MVIKYIKLKLLLGLYTEIVGRLLDDAWVE